MKPSNFCLVVVDVQEKFRSVIHEWDKTLENIVKLIRGAQVLGVPTVVTEQYPKGLGKTVKEISDVLEFTPVEKTCFSCAKDDGFMEALDATGCENVILCGIESHVCVLQTALDLMKGGYDVHYVVDAVSSRNKSDKKIAVRRVVQEGALASSVEMILFQLLEKAGTDEFKKISEIVK